MVEHIALGVLCGTVGFILGRLILGVLKMVEVRQATNKVRELAEEGIISWRDLAEMALSWMSEDDVAEMARANDILYDEEDY